MSIVDTEFDKIVERLAIKVLERVNAGETTIQLKVSPERHRQYSGRIGFALSDALNEAGIHCHVRTWTGAGLVGVLEVAVSQDAVTSLPNNPHNVRSRADK